MKRPERIIYLSAHHLRYWMDHENVVKAEIAREPDATHSVPYIPYSEAHETAVEEIAESRRQSLANEIRETLRARGHYAPERPSDLIGAVGRALDQTAARETAVRELVELVEEAATGFGAIGEGEYAGYGEDLRDDLAKLVKILGIKEAD